MKKLMLLLAGAMALSFTANAVALFSDNEKWFDGGIEEGWPTTAENGGWSNTNGTTYADEKLTVSALAETPLTFTANVAQVTADYKATISSTVGFTAFEELPAVPEGAKAGVISYGGNFYALAINEDGANAWANTGITASDEASVDITFLDPTKVVYTIGDNIPVTNTVAEAAQIQNVCITGDGTLADLKAETESKVIAFTVPNVENAEKLVCYTGQPFPPIPPTEKGGETYKIQAGASITAYYSPADGYCFANGTNAWSTTLTPTSGQVVDVTGMPAIVEAVAGTWVGTPGVATNYYLSIDAAIAAANVENMNVYLFKDDAISSTVISNLMPITVFEGATLTKAADAHLTVDGAYLCFSDNTKGKLNINGEVVVTNNAAMDLGSLSIAQSVGTGFFTISGDSSVRVPSDFPLTPADPIFYAMFKATGNGATVLAKPGWVYNDGTWMDPVTLTFNAVDSSQCMKFTKLWSSGLTGDELATANAYAADPEKQKTGYYFNGEWTPEPEVGAPCTEDAIYQACSTAITYTVTYELGEHGQSKGENPDTYTIETETITLAPAVAKAGYVFSNWTNETGVVTEITKGTTGDLTFYAVFEEAGAKIGDVYYLTLADAVKAAESGNEVTLLKDAGLTEGLDIGDPEDWTFALTLDLNGKTISTLYATTKAAYDAPINVFSNATLTITGDGKIAGWTGADAAALDGKSIIAVDGGFLYFENGTLTAGGIGSDGLYGVYVCNGGSAILGTKDEQGQPAGGPTIKTWFAAVGSNNTTPGATGVQVIIYDGTYEQIANGAGKWWHYFCAPIYAPAAGTYSILGGSYTGALYAVSAPYANVGQSVNLSGGTFAMPLYVSETKGAESGMRVVTKGEGVQIAAPAGYDWDENGILQRCEAKIGDVFYITLAKAIEAVQEGQTITLVTDVEGADPLTLTTGFTLDLNGNTFVQNATVTNNAGTFKLVNGAAPKGLFAPNATITVAAGATLDLSALPFGKTYGGIEGTGSLKLESGSTTKFYFWNAGIVDSPNWMFGNYPAFFTGSTIPDGAIVTIGEKTWTGNAEKDRFVVADEIAIATVTGTHNPPQSPATFDYTESFTSIATAFATSKDKTATLTADVAITADRTINSDETLVLDTGKFTIPADYKLTLNGTLKCNADGSNFINLGQMLIAQSANVWMGTAYMFGAGGKFSIQKGEIVQTTNTGDPTGGMKYTISADGEATMLGDFIEWTPGVYILDTYWLNDGAKFTAVEADPDQGKVCVKAVNPAKIIVCKDGVYTVADPIPEWIDPSDTTNVEKYNGWATKYGVTDPSKAKEAAFLFDVENTDEAIAAANEAFKLTITIDSEGKVTISCPTADTYNGTVRTWGKVDLTDDKWHAAQDGDHFFQATLELIPANLEMGSAIYGSRGSNGVIIITTIKRPIAK